MAGYSEVTFHGSSITLQGSSLHHLPLILTVEGLVNAESWPRSCEVCEGLRM